MEPVFIDTSAFYALADKDDRNHMEAKRIVEILKKEKARVFTTNYIIAETHVLILTRINAHSARKWLRNFKFPLIQVTEGDQMEANSIIFNHTDKEYSLTDAVSFSVMKKLSVNRFFAFDVHFSQYGFQTVGG